MILCTDNINTNYHRPTALILLPFCKFASARHALTHVCIRPTNMSATAGEVLFVVDCVWKFVMMLVTL